MPSPAPAPGCLTRGRSGRAQLFHRHTGLILQFNTFLPTGYTVRRGPPTARGALKAKRPGAEGPAVPQIKESDLSDENHPAYVAPMTVQHDSTSPVELEAAPMGHQQMQQMQQGQRPMAPAANPPKKQQVPHLVPHYYCDPYGELSGDAMLSCRTRSDGALRGRNRAGESGLQRGHQVRQQDQGPLR